MRDTSTTNHHTLLHPQFTKIEQSIKCILTASRGGGVVANEECNATKYHHYQHYWQLVRTKQTHENTHTRTSTATQRLQPWPSSRKPLSWTQALKSSVVENRCWPSELLTRWVSDLSNLTLPLSCERAVRKFHLRKNSRSLSTCSLGRSFSHDSVSSHPWVPLCFSPKRLAQVFSIWSLVGGKTMSRPPPHAPPKVVQNEKN